MILNRARDYYENNKELLRKKAKNKYGELSDKEIKNMAEIDIIAYLKKRDKD